MSDPSAVCLFCIMHDEIHVICAFFRCERLKNVHGVWFEIYGNARKEIRLQGAKRDKKQNEIDNFTNFRGYIFELPDEKGVWWSLPSVVSNRMPNQKSPELQ